MANRKDRATPTLPPAGTYPVAPDILARSEALLPRLKRSRWTRLAKMPGLLAVMIGVVFVIYIPGLEEDARVTIAHVWLCVFGLLTFRAFIRFVASCNGASVWKESLDEYREGRCESAKFKENFLAQAKRFADGKPEPKRGEAAK